MTLVFFSGRDFQERNHQVDTDSKDLVLIIEVVRVDTDGDSEGSSQCKQGRYHGAKRYH